MEASRNPGTWFRDFWTKCGRFGKRLSPRFSRRLANKKSSACAHSRRTALRTPGDGQSIRSPPKSQEAVKFGLTKSTRSSPGFRSKQHLITCYRMFVLYGRNIGRESRSFAQLRTFPRDDPCNRSALVDRAKEARLNLVPVAYYPLMHFYYCGCRRDPVTCLRDVALGSAWRRDQPHFTPAGILWAAAQEGDPADIGRPDRIVIVGCPATQP